MKKLVVFVGPSGGGKGTFLKYVLATRNDVVSAISVTTRAPRAGEIDGKDYYFVDDKTFRQWHDEGRFVESNFHFSASYGSLRSELVRDQHVAVDVDVNGAQAFRRLSLPGLVLIFITVSDLSKLPERIIAREGSREKAAKRLVEAAEKLPSELDFQQFCDYTIVNDDLEVAKSELDRILAEIL